MAIRIDGKALAAKVKAGRQKADVPSPADQVLR